jgi:Zn finger protein HypA/HybF involved in hydrogenase expression
VRKAPAPISFVFRREQAHASRMIISFMLPETPRTPTCAACLCSMNLATINWQTERDDLYTFDCPTCDAIETQIVTCQ